MPVYLHNGAMGDIIYALPVLRAQPGILVLTKERQMEFLHPLLALQPYIQETTLERPWTKLKDDPNNDPVKEHYIDLRKYRNISEADYTKHLTLCHAEAVSVPVNSRTQWLYNVIPKYQRSIIINRTKRYHGELNWHLLKSYEEEVGFVGTEKEYAKFRKETGVVPEWIPVTDALHMAQVIAGSSLFIGNQSCAFAIAEALKHPRMLEVSHDKPNCMPHSAEGWVELTTGRIERCIEECHNTLTYCLGC